MREFQVALTVERRRDNQTPAPTRIRSSTGRLRSISRHILELLARCWCPAEARAAQSSSWQSAARELHRRLAGLNSLISAAS